MLIVAISMMLSTCNPPEGAQQVPASSPIPANAPAPSTPFIFTQMRAEVLRAAGIDTALSRMNADAAYQDVLFHRAGIAKNDAELMRHYDWMTSDQAWALISASRQWQDDARRVSLSSSNAESLCSKLWPKR